MLVDLPLGAKEIPVPNKILKLVPVNYIVEAAELEDGQLQISIIRIKNVTCKINKADLLMTDTDIQDKILNPMLGVFKNA